MMSSSPVSECSRSSRPRKLPSVTPRRFNRFFDRRSSHDQRSFSTPSSRALRELTSGALNQRHGTIIENNCDAFPDLPPAKRRKGAASTLGPDGRATPIPSDDILPSSPIYSSPFAQLDSSPCPSSKSPSSVLVHEDEYPKPICRSRVKLQPVPDYRDLTADFYSAPDDTHHYTHPIAPYCIAACSTNTLVAIGDEQGSIRLVESAQDEKPGFGTPYLSFQPHNNAIMHLAFSSDDRVLATGSGDQTTRIIDMPTQTTIHTLSGSTSTVRHVAFQPGNDNILASCSRDGSVSLFDIRSSKNVAKIQHIPQAHLPSDWPSNTSKPAPSVTSLQFLSQAHPHLFLTSSDASARLRLWDVRGRYTVRQRAPTPISTTAPPPSHTADREYGVVSLASSGDSSRIYAVCRDNTVYAYSTNHVILGQAPELNSAVSAFKAQRGGAGLGPLYGFRHALFRAHSFYVRAAMRKATTQHPELLAVGSSEGCPLLFPTSERFLSRPTVVGGVRMYDVGTPLVHGHDMGYTARLSSKPAKEVTGVAWTTAGELVSVGDDYRVRCWRQDAKRAQDLRARVDGEAGRWGCGWADMEAEWDEEDG